jgi:hypothetical protein
MTERVAGTSMISSEIFADIARDIRAGLALRDALRERHLSPKVYYDYVSKNRLAGECYARARMESLDAIAEEAMGIADDPDIASDHKRVMVDTRKWFLSKLAPKRYGDHIDVNVTGNRGGETLEDADLVAVALNRAVPKLINASE